MMCYCCCCFWCIYHYQYFWYMVSYIELANCPCCHHAFAPWLLWWAPADPRDPKCRRKLVLKMDGWIVLYIVSETGFKINNYNNNPTLERFIATSSYFENRRPPFRRRPGCLCSAWWGWCSARQGSGGAPFTYGVTQKQPEGEGDGRMELLSACSCSRPWLSNSIFWRFFFSKSNWVLIKHMTFLIISGNWFKKNVCQSFINNFGMNFENFGLTLPTSSIHFKHSLFMPTLNWTLCCSYWGSSSVKATLLQ